MYQRGYYARDLNSEAPIRFVQFVPRFFPRCPLYSFVISMGKRVKGGKTEKRVKGGKVEKRVKGGKKGKRPKKGKY